MLVSKIKPCKCKHESRKRRGCERLIKSVVVYVVVRRGASVVEADNFGKSRANTCKKAPPLAGRRAFISHCVGRAACLTWSVVRGDSG